MRTQLNLEDFNRLLVLACQDLHPFHLCYQIQNARQTSHLPVISSDQFLPFVCGPILSTVPGFNWQLRSITEATQCKSGERQKMWGKMETYYFIFPCVLLKVGRLLERIERKLLKTFGDKFLVMNFLLCEP